MNGTTQSAHGAETVTHVDKCRSCDLARAVFILEETKLPIAANDNEPLGRIYTFEEAAEKLHVGKRSMQGIVKRHPHYAKNGRVYLFSETDIQLIWEGMRCRCDSSNERGPITGTSVAPSANSLYSKARALTTKKPQRQSVSNAKLAS